MKTFVVVNRQDSIGFSGTKGYIAPFISQPMQIPVPMLPVKVQNHINTDLITSQVKLKNVMFEITKKCNLSCIHCYCNGGYNEEDELSTKEIIEFITRLSRDGIETITFTGGEPLLRKDLISILEFASNCGLGITIFTNGTLIDKRLLEIITKVNIDTDLRLAFTAGIREILSEKPELFDPRKIIGAGRALIKEVVKNKIEVLGSAGKA